MNNVINLPSTLLIPAEDCPVMDAESAEMHRRLA